MVLLANQIESLEQVLRQGQAQLVVQQASVSAQSVDVSSFQGHHCVDDCVESIFLDLRIV